MARRRFINLTLLLAERIFGVEVARAASRMFLIDPNKSPQSAYAIFASQKAHGDEPILKAQDWIESHADEGISVEALARRVAMSPRTFARRFRAATGNTARDYIQRARIEAAKRALENGASVADTVRGVGYDSAVAFRRLFVRAVGLTPADYRTRYGPRSELTWVGRPRR